MASKTDRTVVRDTGRQAKSFDSCERHNERENETYHNSDVVLERANLNVHFLKCEGETYEQKFNRLIENGTIVKRGLKADAKIFSELVFDVNTDYFERNGGYEFAKKFYEEAYRMAVKEIGGEQYILSAVLHADERNKALSEQLGRDVYHYHLHVVYVPVVEKEVLWTKRCKDPALISTVKEIIPQISHSKKWPIRVPVERNGKTIILNSYSLLQDRYFEHMRAAGFEGFERGERGSTAEHLDVLDYKIQQDNKRLDTLDQKIEKKQERVEKLDEKLAVKSAKTTTLAEIDAMGKPTLLGNGYTVTNDEMKKLKSLARQTVKSDERIAKLKRDITDLKSEIDKTKSQLRDAQSEARHWYQEFTDLKEKVKDYLRLAAKFPERIKEFFTGLFREEQAQEQQREAERQSQIQQPTKTKIHNTGGR
jgi:predicted  nucleic acid-binding Zn-ribbon protein